MGGAGGGVCGELGLSGGAERSKRERGGGLAVELLFIDHLLKRRVS